MKLDIRRDFIARHTVYCAWRDGRVVGFYALEAIGQGIGAQLLAHAVLTMRRDGAGMLRIASDPNAEGFYVKMGARRVGEVPSRPDGRRLPLLVLEACERRTR